MKRGRTPIKQAVAVVFLTECFGVACGGDNEPQATTASRDTGTPKVTPPTEMPIRGNGPDIKVDAVESCELVPGGSPSGADVVNFRLPIRNVGNVALESLVTVRTEGSSGLVSTQDLPVASDAASSTTATDGITGREWGQQQRYTILADPENIITELDESNNEMSVLVDFPSAPPPTTAALNCDSPTP